MAEGVENYTMDWDYKALLYKTTVVLDESKTSAQKIAETLVKGGFPIQGDPEFGD